MGVTTQLLAGMILQVAGSFNQSYEAFHHIGENYSTPWRQHTPGNQSPGETPLYERNPGLLKPVGKGCCLGVCSSSVCWNNLR